MMASQAEPALLMSGSWQRLLLARWLHAEADRALGNNRRARELLEKTLQQTEAHEQPQIAERCFSSLGAIALYEGDLKLAEANFRRAIELTEELRAPIPGEEFRTAFFANRMSPYHELAKLCLIDGDTRAGEALAFVERAKSRALADTLSGRITFATELRDDFEAHLQAQAAKLREELNYLYNQMHRSVRGPVHIQEADSPFQRELHERERKLQEISRQLQHRRTGVEKVSPEEDDFTITQLQAALGADRALVEYATIDDQLLAFVVTDQRVEIVRDLGSGSEIVAEIERCRFQIDTLRYGSERVRGHLPALAERTQRHLRALYNRLLQTIEPGIGGRHLVIVPHGPLHYLPFQALHDGDSYLIERREISVAPSAAVLLQCLRHAPHEYRNAAVFGVADEQIPRVREELHALHDVFVDVKQFSDEAATTEALRKNSAGADVVHLACHAHFRSDNPLFSSLRLADGWFTARDAYGLKLNCGLVTLSACETGMNVIAPGDELMGLVRGFLSAGSPTVMMSLWTVDDEATAELMAGFYSELAGTKSPAIALRAAQMKLLNERAHPFFWSPFVLVGRW
jgi:CHAT domain-containing protein